jgi:type VI secretion system secreted protein VgrG
MVEITDRMQVFAPKPALFHGNLETLAPQNRPQPSTEHKVTIAEPKTPEDPKQLLFMLQTHPESGRPFANVPYTLYKNGSQVDEGITDDLGRIAIEHTDGTPGYTVELANGEKFDLKAWEKFDPKDKALHSEQMLSNQGARSLDGSTDGRTHS